MPNGDARRCFEGSREVPCLPLDRLIVGSPSNQVQPGQGAWTGTGPGTSPFGGGAASTSVLCREIALTACGTLPASVQDYCRAAAANLPSCTGGPGGDPFAPQQPQECGPGRRYDVQLRQCVDVTPGTTTPAEGGRAVVGMGGVAARTPWDCGIIKGNPIRCCPKAHVLGVDELCYAKGTLPRAWRKWKPGRKPLVTAGDMRALARFSSVQRKVKNAAGKAGLTTAKKGASRARKHAAGCQCAVCKR